MTKLIFQNFEFVHFENFFEFNTKLIRKDYKKWFGTAPIENSHSKEVLAAAAMRSERV